MANYAGDGGGSQVRLAPSQKLTRKPDAIKRRLSKRPTEDSPGFDWRTQGNRMRSIGGRTTQRKDLRRPSRAGGGYEVR